VVKGIFFIEVDDAGRALRLDEEVMSAEASTEVFTCFNFVVLFLLIVKA